MKKHEAMVIALRYLHQKICEDDRTCNKEGKLMEKTYEDINAKNKQAFEILKEFYGDLKEAGK